MSARAAPQAPGWNTWLGGPLVVFGVWLLARGKRMPQAAAARA